MWPRDAGWRLFGSVLALGLTLERLGKSHHGRSPTPFPEIYHFLPGQDRFIVGKPPEYEYDTFIVLYCSVPERLGVRIPGLP